MHKCIHTHLKQSLTVNPLRKFLGGLGIRKRSLDQIILVLLRKCVWGLVWNLVASWVLITLWL